MKPFRTTHQGFTLAEILVYASLVVLVSLFLTRSLLGVHGAYRKLQSERDVASAIRSVVTELAREVRESRSIYTPTSRFDAANGQLSLESATSTEAAEYLDFYLDNGRVYVKRETADPLPLTPESVLIQEFRVSRPTAGSRETARVTVQAVSRGAGVFMASSTVTASFTPRGNY